VGRAGNPRHQFVVGRHEIRSAGPSDGTTVKLARALWIVHWHWFIAAVNEAARKTSVLQTALHACSFRGLSFFFVLAALANTYPAGAALRYQTFHAGQTRAHSDIVSEIGSGISRDTLKELVGGRCCMGVLFVAGSGAHFAVLHSDGIHRVLAKR